MTMKLYYYSLFSVFCVLAYLIATDPNFGRYFYLVYKLLETKFKSLYYIIKLHPYNFITSWQIRYRSHRMARDIQKYFDKKDK